MPSLSKAGKWRRRLRWALWAALGFVVLIAIGAGLLWYSQERTAAEGKKLLAEAIAETDALDPRWRWEQIQEDLPPIPDNENSMRVITQVADSLQGNDPLPLIFPDGEHVLDDYPSNRQLDQERLKLVQDILNKQQLSLEL